MQKSLVTKVYRIIARSLEFNVKDIAPTDRLEDISDDSIQLFELVLAFEKEFNTQVKYEDLMQIETVGDILAYIERVTSNSHQ